MNQRQLARMVSDGDLTAVAPLLDVLEDRWQQVELLGLVRELASAQKGIYKEDEPFMVHSNKKRGGVAFKRGFDKLFWRELDSRSLVEIISSATCSRHNMQFPFWN